MPGPARRWAPAGLLLPPGLLRSRRVNETTLRKIQAVAAIGAGLVALHGITTDAWQRRHTVFVGVAWPPRSALFVIPLLKKGSGTSGTLRHRADPLRHPSPGEVSHPLLRLAAY